MANRFSKLRELKKEREEEEASPPTPVAESEAIVSDALPKSQAKPAPPSEKPAKRGPGRPPGRRSDPGYTQISAYIPLELLQDVQDALAAERRTLGTRTPRPVSQLVEDLLSEWLAAQKSG